ncbi:hypothetical protein [Hymenobacter sedentarius]|uniref:hypothetical protein n=1 Tax=Hymenobacter sedentarius TaxID=1411621 RepID=UPI000A5A7794|nr:hypothetical protein [Hymenobacter sedentarius]
MLDFPRSSPLQRWVVPAFFAAVLVMGLLLYRDYGFSIDENQQRDTGMVSLKHVAQQIAPAWVAADHEFDRYQTPLMQYYDCDYGVAFETPVSFLERLLGYNDIRHKFQLRHLCTFLVCFGGLIAMYQLAARRFRDWRVGLLAALWLLLSPRLFADFFYNDKDAVFMALFVIATNTGVRLLRRPTAGRVIWHALACAITIDVRIMGVLLPLATVGMLAWRGLLGELKWPRVLGAGVAYGVLTSGLVVLFWPYLWSNPLENFLAAFHNMSAFRWGGSVLYMGNMTLATDLPWHYALVWIAITTPLLYLGMGLLGIGLVIRAMVRQRWRLWASEEQMQDVLFLALCLGPLLAVIVLHSVLYDGWRQLYFVYPPFLLLALRGWVAAAHWRPRWAYWPQAVRAATAFGMLAVAVQMVRDHPFQNVYFNLLAGRHVAERFEMDYWGLGYQQDLKYIATHDPRPSIAVYAPPPNPTAMAREMLPSALRERLVIVYSPEAADYFITNYRWHPEPYPYPNEVYQIRADGRRVHSVFRLRW